MTETTHRPATEADLPILTKIYNDIISEGGFSADLSPYNLDQRRIWFDAHQQAPFIIHVVELESLVLGYFYFSPWRSGRAAMRQVAEVSYYLAKESRGKGLGRFMLEQAQQIARAADLRYLLAILLDTNTGSRSLLEKGGFTLAGHLPDIADMGEQRCGQLIMLKNLEGD
jgi:L-amino acid N-acyltransferase YncA